MEGDGSGGGAAPPAPSPTKRDPTTRHTSANCDVKPEDRCCHICDMEGSFTWATYMGTVCRSLMRTLGSRDWYSAMMPGMTSV